VAESVAGEHMALRMTMWGSLEMTLSRGKPVRDETVNLIEHV
jgi:hypothetical protein